METSDISSSKIFYKILWHVQSDQERVAQWLTTYTRKPNNPNSSASICYCMCNFIYFI